MTPDLGTLVRAVLAHEDRVDQAAAAGVSVSDLEDALAEGPCRRALEAAARKLIVAAKGLERDLAAADSGRCVACARIASMTSEEQNARLRDLLFKAAGHSPWPPGATAERAATTETQDRKEDEHGS